MKRTIELALAKISSADKGWRMIPAKKWQARHHPLALRNAKGLTLVEFRLETGRTHQIRVHALAGPAKPCWAIQSMAMAGRGAPARMLPPPCPSRARAGNRGSSKDRCLPISSPWGSIMPISAHDTIVRALGPYERELHRRLGPGGECQQGGNGGSWLNVYAAPAGRRFQAPAPAGLQLYDSERRTAVDRPALENPGSQRQDARDRMVELIKEAFKLPSVREKPLNRVGKRPSGRRPRTPRRGREGRRSFMTLDRLIKPAG